MDADLVLEGGGVKGIALVGAASVLAEEGYAFHRVAGTSAGAIVGALVAAGMDAEQLQEVMRMVDYRDFKDEGLLDRLGHVGKGMSLLLEKGIYEGNYLKEWLGSQLDGLGVKTFADLRIDDDAGSSLPPDRAYKLVALAADISCGRLVRFPWDYGMYGRDRDAEAVVDAVRASMSIPFFYEPVTMTDEETKETSYLVDGGVLSNFPVTIFDRTDGKVPRWPTFGIKLSARPEAKSQVRHHFSGPLGFAAALFSTCMTAHDHMHLDDECVTDRTIFVDTFGVKATDFDIDEETQDALYESGRRAATRFLKRWDFEDYVKKCRRRDADAGTRTEGVGAR